MIFCVAGVLEAMRDAGSQHFLGAAWTWWIFTGAALRAGLIVGLSRILAPTHGAGGVAAANVAGAAVCLLFYHWILKARVPGYAPFKPLREVRCP